VAFFQLILRKNCIKFVNQVIGGIHDVCRITVIVFMFPITLSVSNRQATKIKSFGNFLSIIRYSFINFSPNEDK